MNRVNINLGNRSYEIIIGNGLLQKCGELLRGLDLGRRVLLVTNPTVKRLFGSTVIESLQRQGFHVTVGEVPDGEEYKNLQQAEKLYDAAFTAGLDRRCPVLALGGGVVGDLAGFVASTYMRGVPFVQLPTTLLAQVDSSVGGKVAVNHPRGKNIVGAFYQPCLVISDTGTLETLKAREVRSGMAEVIKYGIIRDAAFFEWLEGNLTRILSLKAGSLTYVIERSCLNKAEVVQEDETEQGTRAILNLGHTVGHAVESLTGYERYTHGEAVAIGTVVAARIAVELKMLPEEAEERIIKILERTGLPLRVPGHLDTGEIINALYGDKKTFNGRITFILPRSIGDAVICKELGEDIIKRGLEYWK